MDREQFRQAGYAAVDRVCDYFDSIEQHDVVPKVSPGRIASMIERQAPKEGEPWEKIAQDFDRVIMPGITHWQHPNFYAYFPANTTYESILADIHLGAVSNPGFNWLCSPSCTELETVVMDWVAKLLGLDQSWWNESKTGGGIIMGNASEAALTVSIAARQRFLQLEPSTDTSKLVILGTTQTHSLGAKTARILGVGFVAIPTRAEDNWALRGDNLEAALTELENRGRKPFILLATIGTTSTGAVDNLAEITSVTAHHPSLFLHIDAAWAGVYLALEECRRECFLEAINAKAKDANGTTGIAGGEVHSFCTNLHKSGLVTFQASCLWIRDYTLLSSALDVTPHYLRTPQSQSSLVVDYRNWSLFLGRRFHSLKVWYTLRSFGVAGFQAHLRKLIDLAKLVDRFVKEEQGRIELFTPRNFSLVVFRIIHPSGDVVLENRLNSAFMKKVNERNDIMLTETCVEGKVCIRFAVGSRETQERHIRESWERVIRPLIREVRTEFGLGGA
ncbi:uncharacterized protein JCM6883_006188 [Sporobolomyces salmoneus]|uniref:uncharacterized protein n=1 Tax=Sporobolomyces salmoneus TaxID=183962 RepID=UPI00317D6C0B